MSRKKLSLYVWEDFDCVDTQNPGLAVAIACSEDEAKLIISEQMERMYGKNVHDWGNERKPEVYPLNQKNAFFRSGCDPW